MRLFFLCSLCLFLQLSGRAQERVRNVRIRVVDSVSLDIRYDLLMTQPGDSIYLQMRSRLRGSIRILPEFLRGDIGVGISAGSDKHIYWDALANGYSLNEEVQAKVVVKTNPSAGRAQPVKTEPVVAQAPVVTPAESKTVASKPTESVVVATPKSAESTPPAAVTPTPQKQPKRTQPTKPAKPSVFAVDSVTTPAPAPAPTTVLVTPAQPPASTSVVASAPSQAPASTTALPPQATVAQSATVTTDTVPNRKVRHRYAGPAWALLSAVAPGIGNIFVQTPKPRVGLRPFLTVLCYGAVAYGLSEQQKANDEYAIYVQQKNIAEGEPYYQIANDHHHRYYLATRGAAVVAAADVILTFIKGLRNSQIQKEARRIQGVTLRPGWLAGQPTAVIRYSF